MSAQASARTYNQDHIPRKYTPGKRRMSIYWTWSYPWEAQRDLAAMENRFSTMTEVRNVLWPAYETPEWSAAQFLQGIAGTLELFHRSTLSFQKIAGETTGHPVAVFQRIDQAGYKLPIDERILADTDTLMVFGLDHILSEQEAAPEEIAAIREWLKRDGACLLLAPHHDVGFTDDMKQRQMEYLHHGDRARASPAAVWAVYALVDEGAWRSRAQHLRPSAGGGERHKRNRSAHALPRPRQPRPLAERPDPQLPSASAALRTDGRRGVPSRCSRGSRSTSNVRILSPRRATGSSTASCGCRRTSRGPETSFWSIPPISPRSLAARRVSRPSGGISRR